MRIVPTKDGGLRINPETPEDWHILRAVILDANGCETDLASRLGGLVTDETIAEDWRDIIVPDLRESFADDLHYISAAIEAAAAFEESDEKTIWITREDAFTWYSALNQARLAMEEKYKFGPEPEYDAPGLTELRREAILRYDFYTALQGFILEHSL